MARILPPDHPQRYPMAHELHARPFPPLVAPAQAIQLAFKPPESRERDWSDAARDHLEALIDHYGTSRPAAGASHYYGEIGRNRVKWERHTEFVSYTLFQDGETDAPFSVPVESLAPAEWLAKAPGELISAIRLHIDTAEGLRDAEEKLRTKLFRHFIPESLAGAHVAEGQATVFGDFRIHEDGFTRFAVLATPRAGQRRLGRIVQRLIEIENYRMLSMLALPVSRSVNHRLDTIEDALTELIAEIADEGGRRAGRDDKAMLAELTRLSAEIEAISAETAFRFAASNAYSALVEQRIQVLREERAADRQLLSEFMARRFQPAMRTCVAAQKRLESLAGRATRTVRLLGAQVSVAVEAQNQDLLESMNRRAELQLRLQRTVEGLSVVAISYYAVSLVSYFVKPLAKGSSLSDDGAVALVAGPVVLAVYLFVRRIRKEIERDD